MKNQFRVGQVVRLKPTGNVSRSYCATSKDTATIKGVSKLYINVIWSTKAQSNGNYDPRDFELVKSSLASRIKELRDA